MASNMESLSGVTPEQMADELIGRGSAWRFDRAVPGLANVVGELPESQEVAGREQPDAILERQAFARDDLLGDRRQVGTPKRGRRQGRGRGRRGRVLECRAHGQGMAGFVTGWKGVCDSGDTSSTKGWMYR